MIIFAFPCPGFLPRFTSISASAQPHKKTSLLIKKTYCLILLFYGALGFFDDNFRLSIAA
jgi:hypothetical protein